MVANLVESMEGNLEEMLKNTSTPIVGATVGGKKRRKRSTKIKSTKRKSTKRKSTKKKFTKRKSTKRNGRKRKGRK